MNSPSWGLILKTLHPLPSLYLSFQSTTSLQTVSRHRGKDKQQTFYMGFSISFSHHKFISYLSIFIAFFQCFEPLLKHHYNFIKLPSPYFFMLQCSLLCFQWFTFCFTVSPPSSSRDMRSLLFFFPLCQIAKLPYFPIPCWIKCCTGL